MLMYLRCSGCTLKKKILSDTSPILTDGSSAHLKVVLANASLLLSLPESSNQLILPIAIAQLVQVALWWRPVVLIKVEISSLGYFALCW